MLITDYMPGHDTIWIVGNHFASNSADEFFKRLSNTLIKGKKETGTHCGDTFEIKTFHSNQFSSHIHDTLARIYCTFANALSTEVYLSKAVVFVLDNDMLKYGGGRDFGLSVMYSRIIHYLFSEVNKLLTTRKEMSPVKGLHNGYPQVLWIHPPFQM